MPVTVALDWDGFPRLGGGSRFWSELKQVIYNKASSTRRIGKQHVSPAVKQSRRVVRKAFETMNLRPTATLRDVKKRLKDFARVYHPDIHPESERERFESQFKLYTTAYETLRAHLAETSRD